jgi:hypothetical protein
LKNQFLPIRSENKASWDLSRYDKKSRSYLVHLYYFVIQLRKKMVLADKAKVRPGFTVRMK